jgi:hypothetical protein
MFTMTMALTDGRRGVAERWFLCAMNGCGWVYRTGGRTTKVVSGRNMFENKESYEGRGICALSNGDTDGWR